MIEALGRGSGFARRPGQSTDCIPAERLGTLPRESVVGTGRLDL